MLSVKAGDTMHKTFPFVPWQTAYFLRWLRDMSRQGWALTDIRGGRTVFRPAIHSVKIRSVSCRQFNGRGRGAVAAVGGRKPRRSACPRPPYARQTDTAEGAASGRIGGADRPVSVCTAGQSAAAGQRLGACIRLGQLFRHAPPAA